MKVALLDYTGIHHPDPARFAAAILRYTKATRLNMDAGNLSKFYNDSWSVVSEDLEAMSETIPSNWEFVDYTFQISGVSRGFTHQFVRTRTASFAQQTMRVLDMSEGRGWDYHTGPSIKNDDELEPYYALAMEEISESYKLLIERGAKIEDARGILPTNILTNICVNMNMRTFVEMCRKRHKSARVQGEYRDVMDAMIKEVLSVHPFVSIFLQRGVDNSLDELQKLIEDLDHNFTEADRTRAMKLIDIIRSEG